MLKMPDSLIVKINTSYKIINSERREG
uniref:Uncharacterized protein n=1 Tax=Rhizophora mucronata TaxID=61149 RepID=A0A2P2N4D5_RHIMU